MTYFSISVKQSLKTSKFPSFLTYFDWKHVFFGVFWLHSRSKRNRPLFISYTQGIIVMQINNVQLLCDYLCISVITTESQWSLFPLHSLCLVFLLLNWLLPGLSKYKKHSIVLKYNDFNVHTLVYVRLSEENSIKVIVLIYIIKYGYHFTNNSYKVELIFSFFEEKIHENKE